MLEETPLDLQPGNAVGEDELERLEGELRQSQRLEAVGQLASGVAHEFNNILMAIGGHAELVAREGGPGGNGRASLNKIRELTRRGAALAGQLLAFSRRETMELVTVNVNTIVKETARMLRKVMPAQIDLESFAAGDLGNARVDPAQIQQLLVNLAVNARDAMPRGGRLTLETANVEFDRDYAGEHSGVKVGSYVMIAVSDTGTGMDPRTRERIFEPFFTTKPAGEGTGLGLSVVFGIARQHGGHVWVYSEPGHGSTFKVYLPRVEAEPEDKERQDAPADEGLPGGEERVLVAEDDNSVREILTHCLKGCGYQVVSAECPSRAESAFRDDGGIDLLVTDLMMPERSGRELYDRLAAESPGLKVLYISGYTDRALGREGMLEEGSAFLQKPFSLRELARVVREVLDAPPVCG